MALLFGVSLWPILKTLCRMFCTIQYKESRSRSGSKKFLKILTDVQAVAARAVRSRARSTCWDRLNRVLSVGSSVEASYVPPALQ